MRLSSRRATVHAALLLILTASTARADDEASGGWLAGVDRSAHLWVMPEGSAGRADSPFDGAASRAGIGTEVGRAEAWLHVAVAGFTAAVSGRATALKSGASLDGVVNELLYEHDVLGAHLTVGKRIESWDVGFGYRPLDVVQQEDRRAVHPFALEGIPLLSLEYFHDDTAVTLVYANPLRVHSARPQDDPSAALRLYQRLGKLELHAIGRYSARTELEGGPAASFVWGDAVELHASVRWQRRCERLVDTLAGTEGPPLATSDPIALQVSKDAVAALVGANVSPGWDLNVIAEAWLDPTGSTAREWEELVDLARTQRSLVDRGAPESAVLGNLAWGLQMYDRANPLRENLLLHVSQTWGRYEPVLDLLVTPRDKGWVTTASVSRAGERLRLEAGARVFGGAPGSAFRSFPQRAVFYLAIEAFL